MKEALRTCATLEDFEKMLTNWPKPMGVEANFGVIDASGGAAYYETSNFSFKKIDANDPAAAPSGYLIRTNFSFTGAEDKGYGYIRYMTAAALLDQAAARQDLSCQFLLQKVSRSLKHSLLDTDLMGRTDLSEDHPCFVGFEDYIPRHSSVAAMAIQGVRSGEPADLSTAWTLLGFPLCAAAVPVWVSAAPLLPSITAADESGNAPLCQLALQLKRRCYPISRGSGDKYINLAALVNKQQTGIMQKLPEIDNLMFKMGEASLLKWRSKNRIDKNEVKHLYQEISALVLEKYKEFFNASLLPADF